MKKTKIIILIGILVAIGIIVKFSVFPAKADIYGSSLVGYWRFDTNDDLNGVTLDRSDSGNNGNLINIATSTFYSYGKIGQGFNFDGTNDYINLGNPSSLNITGAMTLAAWAKYDTTNTIDEIIARDKSATDKGYRLTKESDGVITCYIASSATVWVSAAAATLPSAGGWYNIACVYTPSTSVIIYINGVQDGINTTSIPASQRSATVGPIIGQRCTTCTGSPFDGIIDDVRVYNRALTAAEVAQLYNQGLPSFISDF